MEGSEGFEELVDEAASHSHWIPDRDNDPLDLVPIPLSDFRAARKALRFLEATPARIRRMEEALWLLEAYKNFDSRTSAATAEFLRALRGEIPTIAERALSKGEAAPAGHAPDAPLVMDDGLIRVLDGLTTALRQIRSMAAEAAPDRPEHELCHLLTVEIPDIAARALHGDGEHFRGGPVSFGDDFDECPF